MTSKASAGAKEQKKERLYRQLGKILDSAGIKVRRERLRQGPGWRAQSGACQAEARTLVFIDSRLCLDDQVNFLVSEIRERKVQISEESLKELPATIQHILAAPEPEGHESAEAAA